MAFDLSAMGMSPQQIQAAHELGKHLRIEIRKWPKEGRLEIRYVAINPEDPGAKDVIGQSTDGLAMQLAFTHDTLFGMKGKIIQEG